MCRRLDQKKIPYASYFNFIVEKYKDLSQYAGTHTSDPNMQEWVLDEENRAKQAVLDWKIDLDTFNSRINDGRSPQDILSDANLDMSPIFKYVMAKMLGLYALLPEFAEDAKEALRQNPGYFCDEINKRLQSYYPLSKEEVFNND